MLIRFPKDDKNFSWTRHIKNKMIFYGLSEQKIKSVLNSPKRKEEGIAPDTLAAMKRNDRGKRREEIWVMYTFASQKSRINADINTRNNADKKSRTKKLMISAWRYPGVSRPGKKILVPEDTLLELEKMA